MSSAQPPTRRASDQVWWRRILRPVILWWQRENVYRDVWLVLISVLVLYVAVVARDAAQDARRAGNDAKAAALGAKQAAKRATDNVALIQRSRIALTREACRADNERHDRTIRRLQRLVSQIPDAAQRAQAQANIKSTISLIDALVPKRDCAVLVKRLTPPPPRP